MGHYDIHKDNCPQNAYLRKLYEIFTPTKMNGLVKWATMISTKIIVHEMPI